MADGMKPAYLIAGDDEAKISAARRRLRERAERETAALELFEPGDARAPDADGLIGALAALSLAATRYLLTDGTERWSAADAKRVAEALWQIPDGTTVVLIARGKAPASLRKAVESAGGDVLDYQAPKRRELPRGLVADARRRGFELAPDAARLLIERLGDNPLRLSAELDRLALWAGEAGSVRAPDLEEMLADTSEAAVWSLGDAIAAGDETAAMSVAESLLAQGESVSGVVYALSRRLRQAAGAAAELEAGRSPKQVAEGLGMHPYAARMLVSKVRGRSSLDLRRAVEAIADLELWVRGGADYDEDIALTLALRRMFAGDEEPAAA